ncbi:Gfo/Idh/MocA family oxidoreductase [Paenibacillus hemerocallicola]|jgi:predicted dehydrogenase|uniref:Gfo/Idh/MocA family oxidoreductase n=1 Tax=Paenibacillus hemerocallicola TaxID=1172614 RepID=A0A5C4TC93_9BACL|nr:Gfo/Idh/MocA family oxidoreductase [Paenibacillus hemerocallicola]TNJ66180.1 Gfo/Idh/MocA family oxidoreductase [Paenibacillus hemerocallicola]
MTDTIKWGIIGCGNVTEVKSGPGFQLAEGSELIAVMRRNGELAADYARRHEVRKWYDDADALIADPEVNAVYVATPPSTHKAYALAAAKAGKPVYVEKPMALHARECVDMIEACRDAGVPLFVAYYRRALPRFLKVKQLLEMGTIGDIRFVTTVHTKKLTEDPANLPWRVIPELSGGGHFFDLASHTLDLLDFLLGPIRDASGRASNQGKAYAAEDIVSGTYVFESGVQGTGLWCFTAYQGGEINEIVGSRGKLTFSTFGSEPIRLTTADGIGEYSLEQPKHIQQPLIQTIVNELLGKGNCSSTGVSALRTAKVMDELASMR